MPLSVKTIKGVVTLTWSTPTMEASWKISPSMPEAEVMDTLCRVVIFVNSQNRQHQKEVAKLEYELLETPQNAAAAPALPAPSETATSAGANSQAGRILMPPPSQVGDRPSDGGPPKGGIDFASMPTTTVPAELQQFWEMAPPEEMTW